MLGGGNSELVVEAVMPDLGHVVPVVDDAVLDGVRELEDALLGLSLFTHISVFIVHAHHNVLVLGATHNGRKHGTRSIVTSKTGFAHTGTVIYHKSLNIFVGHL